MHRADARRRRPADNLHGLRHRRLCLPRGSSTTGLSHALRHRRPGVSLEDRPSGAGLRRWRRVVVLGSATSASGPKGSTCVSPSATRAASPRRNSDRQRHQRDSIWMARRRERQVRRPARLLIAVSLQTFRGLRHRLGRLGFGRRARPIRIACAHPVVRRLAATHMMQRNIHFFNSCRRRRCSISVIEARESPSPRCRRPPPVHRIRPNVPSRRQRRVRPYLVPLRRQRRLHRRPLCALRSRPQRGRRRMAGVLRKPEGRTRRRAAQQPTVRPGSARTGRSGQAANSSRRSTATGARSRRRSATRSRRGRRRPASNSRPPTCSRRRATRSTR